MLFVGIMIYLVVVIVPCLGTVYGWGMGSTKQLGQGDDEDDVFEPVIITGKQLQNKFVCFMLFEIIVVSIVLSIAFSALTRLGVRKSIRPIKNLSGVWCK